MHLRGGGERRRDVEDPRDGTDSPSSRAASNRPWVLGYKQKAVDTSPFTAIPSASWGRGVDMANREPAVTELLLTVCRPQSLKELNQYGNQ